jgi:tetratricopeptide (TPR) repeat protein
MDDEIYSNRQAFENALAKAREEERWNDVGGHLRDACLLYTDLVDDLKEALLEAAECFEKEGNKAEQAWCYHDLGSWYLEATKGTEAVEWLEKSMELFEELGDVPGAEEGIESTREALRNILSDKPFSSQTPITINQFKQNESNDPTDLPAIKMGLGFTLMLFGFAAGSKDWILPSLLSCGGGLIILIIGALGMLKARFSKSSMG